MSGSVVALVAEGPRPWRPKKVLKSCRFSWFLALSGPLAEAPCTRRYRKYSRRRKSVSPEGPSLPKWGSRRGAVLVLYQSGALALAPCSLCIPRLSWAGILEGLSRPVCSISTPKAHGGTSEGSTWSNLVSNWGQVGSNLPQCG